MERGEHPERTEAFRLFTDAAANGSVEAIGNLGVLYMRGEGVPKKDLQKAADQFKEASLKGDTSSMYYYAQCLLNGWGVSANLEEATKWFHDAAVAGDPEAGEWCKKNKVEYEMKKRALPE